MKTILIILSTLLLFSCGGIRNGNFNKQKYTTLKKQENQIENPVSLAEEEVETETVEPSEMAIPENETEQLDQEESGITQPPQIDPIDESNPETDESKIVSKLMSTPLFTKIKDNLDAIIPIEKPNADPEPTEKTNSTKPLIIAWAVYIALGISSLISIYIGLVFEISTLIIIGFAIWPILIILGVLLLSLVVRERKKQKTTLLKFIEAMTFVELILATVGVLVFILIYLLLDYI